MTMAVSHMYPGSTSLALTEWMPHVTRFDFPYKIKSKRIDFCLFLFLQQDFKDDIALLQALGATVKLGYGGEEWGNPGYLSKVTIFLQK